MIKSNKLQIIKSIMSYELEANYELQINYELQDNYK